MALFPTSLGYKNDDYDIRYFPVTAGQTFVAGDFVVLSSQELVVCATDDAVLFLGIALAPASMGLATAGSVFGGTNIPVAVLTPGTVLFMPINTGTPANTQVGEDYGIIRGAAGRWQVEVADTTNVAVLVQGISTVADQLGFWVRPLASACQLDAIAS